MKPRMIDPEYEDRCKLEDENAKLRAEVESYQRQLSEWYDKLQGTDENWAAAALQVKEAMKACPWATHKDSHVEPKHCIQALVSMIEMLQREIKKAHADKKTCPICGAPDPKHRPVDCPEIR